MFNNGLLGSILGSMRCTCPKSQLEPFQGCLIHHAPYLSPQHSSSFTMEELIKAQAAARRAREYEVNPQPNSNTKNGFVIDGEYEVIEEKKELAKLENE